MCSWRAMPPFFTLISMRARRRSSSAITRRTRRFVVPAGSTLRYPSDLVFGVTRPDRNGVGEARARVWLVDDDGLHAELIPLGISQNYPGMLSLPNIDGNGSEIHEASHLGGLIRPPDGQVQMHPVLTCFGLRYLDEHEDYAKGVVRTGFRHPEIRVLLLDLPSQDSAPECRHGRGVDAINNRLTDDESHGGVLMRSRPLLQGASWVQVTIPNVPITHGG